MSDRKDYTEPGKRSINQYQQNPQRQDDTIIFPPRFTCLPASYIPVVVIHPLGGSRANPQPGAAQPTQDGDP